MVDRYRKPKPMKRAERKDPLALLSGPCCGRCGFWTAPDQPDKDPFGECARVVCAEQRVGTIEKGTLITLEELRKSGLQIESTPMRTRSWMRACPLYADADTIARTKAKSMLKEGEPEWAA
jgi:hypothetical protein